MTQINDRSLSPVSDSRQLDKVILLTCCGRHFSGEVTPQTPTRTPGLILLATSMNINEYFLFWFCCVFFVPVIYPAPLAALPTCRETSTQIIQDAQARSCTPICFHCILPVFPWADFSGFTGGGVLDLNSTLFNF